MKLNYAKQLTLSVCIVILANILSTICRHWIFRSIGFGISGFLWVIHPVMMNGKAATQKERTLIRFAGIVLIFIGIFTRSYLY